MARETIASLTKQRDAAIADRKQWEQKWNDIWPALQKKADENDLCELFDEIVEELGGIARAKDAYQVTITLTANRGYTEYGVKTEIQSILSSTDRSSDGDPIVSIDDIDVIKTTK